MDGTNSGSRPRNAAAPTGASAQQPPPPNQPAGDASIARKRQLLAEATAARDFTTPATLSVIIGGSMVSPQGARVYVNSFHRDAGDREDPVERIMLEQLLLAHHRVAQLHVQADKATNPEHIKIFNTAAARLLGEVRRMSLAIRQYRAPVAGRSFSVVHQQNVVAGGGDQQVSYVDQSSAGQDRVTFAARSELEGKPRQGDVLEPNSTPEEPEARGRWSEERVAAPAVVG